MVGRPSFIHTLLCLVVSGRDKRLVRGPADPLATNPSPIARIGATVTEGDPLAEAFSGGRDGGNPVSLLVPLQCTMYKLLPEARSARVL